MKTDLLLLKRCILFIFILSALKGYTQTNKKMNHLIGGNIGMTSGIGFSYQLTNENFGWQTTGLFLFESKFYSRTNIGTMFLHKFYKTDKFQLFNYVSGYLRVFKSDDSYFNIEDESYIEQVKSENHIHAGIGHGIAFNLTERLVYNLQLGYGLFHLQRRNPQSFFTLETSLLYRIN